jgi:hypothetical protein
MLEAPDVVNVYACAPADNEYFLNREDKTFRLDLVLDICRIAVVLVMVRFLALAKIYASCVVPS